MPHLQGFDLRTKMSTSKPGVCRAGFIVYIVFTLAMSRPQDRGSQRSVFSLI
jgi:hypothetical protein